MCLSSAYTLSPGGNTSDYCQVAVEVSDPSNLCEDVEAGRIAGVMMTELAQPVENTTVELTSSTDMEMTMVTSSDGAFNFRSVDLGDDYTITPTHFVDYLNGVRTSDIVAITRHILGVDPTRNALPAHCRGRGRNDGNQRW